MTQLRQTLVMQEQTEETFLLNPEREDALDDIIGGPLSRHFETRRLKDRDRVVVCRCKLSDVVMALLLYDDALPWLDT